MSIPALDGVYASKVGIIRDDGRVVVCELFDDGVEGTHDGMGDLYKRARGFFVRNHKDTPGVVPEVVMTDPDENNLDDFSEDFVETMSEVYDLVVGDIDEPQEIDYDALDEDENRLANYVVALLNHDELPQSIWHSVVTECHRRHDGVGRGIDIVENRSRPFSESEFSEPNYIPEESLIEDGRIVANELIRDDDGEVSASLWFQYETLSGDWREIPLALESNGRFIAYEHSLDFGEDSDPISDEFADALQAVVDGDTPETDSLTDGERFLTEALAAVDLEGTHTERVLAEYL